MSTWWPAKVNPSYLSRSLSHKSHPSCGNYQKLQYSRTRSITQIQVCIPEGKRLSCLVLILVRGWIMHFCLQLLVFFISGELCRDWVPDLGCSYLRKEQFHILLGTSGQLHPMGESTLTSVGPRRLLAQWKSCIPSLPTNIYALRQIFNINYITIIV